MGRSGHKLYIRNGTDETIVIFPADREVTQLWACQVLKPGERKEIHFPDFKNIHIENREGCRKLKLNINDPENHRLTVIPSSVRGEHLKLQTSICSSQSHTLPSSNSNHGQGSNLQTTSSSSSSSTSSSSLSTSHSTHSTTFAAASRSSQSHHTPHIGSSTHGQGLNLQTTPRPSSSSTSSSSFSTSHSTRSTTFAALNRSSQSHHTPHHGSRRLGEHSIVIFPSLAMMRSILQLEGQRRKA